MQAAASSVSFLTAPHVLASAGLDEQLMLLDRRSNSVAASVSTKRPLHSMACREDGNTIAVGNSGECAKPPSVTDDSTHDMYCHL